MRDIRSTGSDVKVQANALAVISCARNCSGVRPRLHMCFLHMQDEMSLQVAWLAASMSEHEQCKVG